jgi:hypothetical protein
MKPGFINVDLDIASRRSLELLGNEFQSLGADVLFCGKIPQGYLLRLEAGSSSSYGIDRTIDALCELIDRLSPKARLLVDAAQSRDFDVGVDGTDGHEIARVSVSPKSVQRIAALGGTLTVTVYRPEEDFHSVTSPTKPKAQRAGAKTASGKAPKAPDGF